jgi:hypothetical protein
MPKEKRYDVVVRHSTTNKIVSIAGRNMSEAQADEREMTVLHRINLDDYHAEILPHHEGRKVQK